MFFVVEIFEERLDDEDEDVLLLYVYCICNIFKKKINIFFFIFRIVLFKMVEVLILGDELSDEDL